MRLSGLVWALNGRTLIKHRVMNLCLIMREPCKTQTTTWTYVQKDSFSKKKRFLLNPFLWAYVLHLDIHLSTYKESRLALVEDYASLVGLLSLHIRSEMNLRLKHNRWYMLLYAIICEFGHDMIAMWKLVMCNVKACNVQCESL